MTDETEAGQEAQAEEKSLGDMISAAWDEQASEEKDETGKTDEAGEEAAAEGEHEASGETEEIAEAPEDASEEEGEEESAEVEPPEHWSQEDKDKFEKLPDEGKEYVLDVRKSLEKGYNEKFQEIADQRKELEALDQLFEPYRDQLRVAGIDRTTAVARLVRANDYLTQSPGQALPWLAQQYGSQLGENDRKAVAQSVARSLGVDIGSQGEQAEDYLDPRTAKELEGLKSQVHQIGQQFTSSQQAQQQAQQQAVQQQIEDFKNATDEQGSPKRPHFDKVREAMGALINSGQASDLESAYEQAIWAQPELRASLLEQQSQEKAKEKERKRKEEVQKAKKASRNPKSKSSNVEQKPAGPTNLRDQVTAVYDEVTAEE